MFVNNREVKQEDVSYGQCSASDTVYYDPFV